MPPPSEAACRALIRVQPPGQLREEGRKALTRCTTATATVGTGGGTVSTLSGAEVTVPYGALDAPTELTVTTTSAPVPAEVGALSPVYQFSPEGTVFARPVTVSLPLPAGVSRASIYWSKLGSTTEFEPIGGTIADGFITAETSHFGLAVIGTESTVRTVNGVGQTTWVSATTRVSEPMDFGAQRVEVLVPDGAGGYRSLPGVGGLGTFTVQDVPVGPYMLHAGTQYLVTSSNTPDLGRVLGGRPAGQRTALQGSSILDLDLVGLDPWDDAHQLEFYSTQADDWDFETDRFATIAPGATRAQLTFDLRNLNGGAPSLILGSRGDQAIIAQLSQRTSTTGVPYLAMTRAAMLPSFDTVEGGHVSLSVPMQDVARGNTLSVDFRGTQFVAALAQDGNPDHVTVCWLCGGFAGVLAQAGGAEDGFYTSNADPLLLNDSAPGGTDLVSGEMQYGTPALAGTWGLLFDARWNARTFPSPLPGSTGLAQNLVNGIYEGIEWVTTTDVGQAGPIVPPITPPTAIQVAGQPAFAGGGNIGLTPTLSWSAPRVGTPDFYRVSVRRLFVNGNHKTAQQVVANIITPGTSLQLPPGMLQPDQAYVFQLTAVRATSAGTAELLATAPFKSALHMASAAVTSKTFWTGTPPPQVEYARVTTIQAGLRYPMGLVATDTALYWTERYDSPWDSPQVDSGMGRIWTSGLDGSNPHVIADLQHAPVGIAADERAVYWTNFGTGQDGTLSRLDLATGLVTTLAAGQGWLGTGLLVVNGQVYWSGAGVHTLDPWTMQDTVLSWDGGVNLASDGTNLYWTQYASSEGNTGRVYQLPLGGGFPLMLADGQADAWDVQTHGGFVYWSNQAWQQSFPASINRVPVGGGPLSTVATGSEMMKVFAVDGESAYYVDSGTLYAAPVSGGTPRPLAQLFSGGCPEGKMAVRGHHVYWTDTCSQSVQHASW